MSAFEIPEHIDILQPPELTDGFSRFPVEVAQQLSTYALEPALASAPASSADTYARAAVGSNTLALFYQRVNQVFDYHNEARGAARTQPVAILGLDDSILLAGAIRRTGEHNDTSPNIYGSLLPYPSTKIRNYGLYINLGYGANGNMYIGRARGDNVEKKRIQGDSNPPTHTSELIEAVRWAWSGETAQVARNRRCKAIAIGAPAVEALLDAHHLNWSNAYDRLLGSAVQEI